MEFVIITFLPIHISSINRRGGRTVRWLRRSVGATTVAVGVTKGGEAAVDGVVATVIAGVISLGLDLVDADANGDVGDGIEDDTCIGVDDVHGIGAEVVPMNVGGVAMDVSVGGAVLEMVTRGLI